MIADVADSTALLDAIVAHGEKSILDGAVFDKPYPHLVFKNFFADDVYLRLISGWPDIDRYVDLNGARTRKQYTLWDPSVEAGDARMTDIVANLRVFPERMRRNLEATRGLVFSGQLLQDLVERGAPRDDAYKWVQEHAMAAWESDTSFRERVAADARIAKFLDTTALDRTFDLQRQLHSVDTIF